MIQHYRISTPGSLAQGLAEQDISANQLDQLLGLGALYLNGHRLFLTSESPGLSQDIPVQVGDIVRVHHRPRRFFWQPHKVTAWIRYQSDNILLVEKPTGLPTHATLDNAKEHLLAHLQAGGFPEALMVHRLDVGTEGLILFARHPEAQKNLQQQIQERLMTKIYSAVVQGAFYFEGEMATWMEKSARAPKRQHFAPGPDRESCLTHLRESEIIGETPEGQACSRLHLELVTGRTHQIRSQLNAFGHSILGDQMYGSEWAWLSTEHAERFSQEDRAFESNSKSSLMFRQNESWALRALALGWSEGDIEHFYELKDYSVSEINLRLKSPSSVTSRSDFGSSAGLRSTTTLQRIPLAGQSLGARLDGEVPEPPAPMPQ